MSLDPVWNADDSGVLVVSAWRVAPGHTWLLRVTSSRGDESETSTVTVSAEDVESVVRLWLLQLAEIPRLLG
jgi:hypothetical protein